ncbi:ABC transporter substrate-binding protein [Consotaella aegiceratis]|uniref:ABC transporter substrate-binding protein n=1 Tax=Consotaella aegiceratis TaxID=3097961 RepID=UPI002F4245C4
MTLSGVTRRHFIAGSAAVGVLALSGGRRALAASEVDFKIPEPIGDLKADGPFRWIDSGDQKGVFFKEFFPAYEAARGVETVYDGLPWQEISTVLPLGIRNGTAQDAFCLPLNVSPGYAVAQGWVQPFDDLIPDFEAWKANFPAGSFLEGLNVFDGKAYGLPYTSGRVSSAHILFNRKLMEAAGLDPQATSFTWSGFRDAAKKITEASSGSAYGFIIGGAQINRWQDTTRAIAQMAGASGGSHAFYSDLNFRTGELLYDTDEYVGAVELLLAMNSDGSVFPGSMGMTAPQARAFMPQGVAGMILQGPWNVPQWERENPDFDFGVAKPPLPDDKDPLPIIAEAVPSVANIMFIYAKAKNPMIAADVFRYLGTEDGQIAWGSLDGPADPPIMPSAIEKASMSERSKAILTMANEIIRVGPNPFVRNPALSEVTKVYQEPTPSFAQTVQGLFTGQITDVKKNMQLLKSNTDKAIDAAFKLAQEAGAEVSRDDLVFPNWEPTKDYTQADYDAL